MKNQLFVRITMLTGFTLLLVLSLFFSSCKKESDTPDPGPNEVIIQDMAFSPGTITVAANTTVTWTNKDGVAHTVTSNTGLFDSGTINANGTFSHTFPAAGTYPYHCTLHPAMTASVIVN